MRYVTDKGIKLIKAFEGYSNIVYLDSAGLETIGYGHLLRGESFTEITNEQAEELLRKDLYSAERSVLRLIESPLTDNQFDALVSFTFNLGGAVLQRSTLRAKINRGESPYGEFERWCWAGGKKLKGLIKRRLAESNLFFSRL